MARVTEDYRNWTRDVRSEARRKIVELRADRIAKKRAARPPAAEAAPAEPAGQLPLTVSRRTAAMLVPGDSPAQPGSEPQLREDAGDAGPVHAAEGNPVPEQPSSAPAKLSAEEAEDHSADLPEAQAPDPASPGDAREAEASLPPAEGQTAAQAAEPAPEPATAAASPGAPLDWDAEQLRSSDLHALPGIGTGLVWLLHANGISSLAELAEAEADSLSDRLGLVGRLIDLRSWMETARARTGKTAP